MRKNYMIGFFLIGFYLIGFSGCALLKPRIEPAGVTDYVQLPVGTVITKVPLPTDEQGKLYNIVISKPSIAISLDCWDRVKK